LIAFTVVGLENLSCWFFHIASIASHRSHRIKPGARRFMLGAPRRAAPLLRAKAPARALSLFCGSA